MEEWLSNKAISMLVSIDSTQQSRLVQHFKARGYKVRLLKLSPEDVEMLCAALREATQQKPA
jgi:hypothetical protein